MGYRIVEDKETELYLKKAMGKILDEIFLSSDKLSSEEIKDVEVSKKEIAEGKCKTFKNVKDLIVDLHETRKKEYMKSK